MSKKLLYIFLNNKIISCDTILPITLYLKNKYKEVDIQYKTFDEKTYDIIKKNINIYNLILKHANISVFGNNRFKNQNLNRIFKFIDLLKIIFCSLLFNTKNIHFKGLENFPFSLIYYFNKKNTFLFESNCWGTNSNIIFADKILDKREVTDKEKFPLFNKYHTLIAFGPDWHQIKYAKKLKKKIMIAQPSRLLSSWKTIVKNNASHQIPDDLQRSNKKKIVYILGSMGKGISSVDKSYSGAMLFKKTMEIILENSDYHILLKPHAITNMDIMYKILKNFDKTRFRVVDYHIAFISQISDIVIGNYFSQAMPDAWANGTKTIEFSKYDQRVLKHCKNGSVSKEYVDVFINGSTSSLVKELKKKNKKIKRKISQNLDNDTMQLLKQLSFKK